MTAVLLTILVPAAAALIGVLATGNRRAASVIAVGGALVTFAITAGTTLANVASGVSDSVVYGTIPTGGPPVQVALRLDGLSATVAVMVAAVALAVQIYSVGYLANDERYPSYAALVSLFSAGMLLVVHADDLIVLLVGWEVMGICSAFLVGHHWEQRVARAAGVKAFLVTRLGDVAFLFGIFGLGLGAGTFRIQDIALLVGTEGLSGTALTVSTLLLLGGVVGKSAQFPLHVWLPDAMAGPTPVSALIHAATMVAAGVFLVARLHEAFGAAPVTLAVLAVIACLSMLGAALAALVQGDLKRVLAYSTISQLSFMFVALALQADAAAIFHLLTHGAFKALLFLGAGAVIHVVGSNLMADMGGLRRVMPWTFWCMTIGLAALVGIPPTSGFFSKESILAAAEHSPAGWVHWMTLLVSVLTVGVTAAYATRLWLLTFFGPDRANGHEVAWIMRGPVLVLAVAASGLGIVGLRAGWLPTWVGTEVITAPPGGLPIERPEAAESLAPTLTTSVLSLAIAAVGCWLAYAWWRRGTAAVDERASLDGIYDRLFVAPVRRLTALTVAADRGVVSAAVAGTGAATQGLASLVRRNQDGDLQRVLTVVLAGTVLLVVAAWVAVAA